MSRLQILWQMDHHTLSGRKLQRTYKQRVRGWPREAQKLGRTSPLTWYLLFHFFREIDEKPHSEIVNREDQDKHSNGDENNERETNILNDQPHNEYDPDANPQCEAFRMNCERTERTTDYGGWLFLS